jgi:hypothetical protein
MCESFQRFPFGECSTFAIRALWKSLRCYVSALDYVRTLVLSHCSKIRDIRALGRVRHLDLLGLDSLDYGLPNDNTVKIFCISYSLLKMVSSFYFKEQKHLTVYCQSKDVYSPMKLDVPLLDGYQTISFQHLSSTVITNLPSLKKLSLIFCSDISLSVGLPSLTHFDISYVSCVGKLFESFQFASLVSLSIKEHSPSSWTLPVTIKESTVKTHLPLCLSLTSDLRLLFLYLDHYPEIPNLNRFRIGHLKLLIKNMNGEILQETWA